MSQKSKKNAEGVIIHLNAALTYLSWAKDDASRVGDTQLFAKVSGVSRAAEDVKKYVEKALDRK